MMFCKILGPCCQTSQMSWMQCSIWREIVIDESVDSSDGDDSDEDDSDDCFNDTCDNDRTGQIIIISKLLLKRKIYLNQNFILEWLFSCL